jgi:penicillin amidase
VPNNLKHAIGPAPWAVKFGPSTRRVIDFADPAKRVGINPVGKAVCFLIRTTDQAGAYMPKAICRSS